MGVGVRHTYMAATQPYMEPDTTPKWSQTSPRMETDTAPPDTAATGGDRKAPGGLARGLLLLGKRR
jgi:hypothetical protein